MADRSRFQSKATSKANGILLARGQGKAGQLAWQGSTQGGKKASKNAEIGSRKHASMQR